MIAAPAFLRRSLSLTTTKGQTASPTGDYRPSRSLSLANSDGGRPAYDPAILLKIVLFGYSRGITSSRDLEWQCSHNIIFKALCCDRVPHFTTIADFISSRSKDIESLFEQVLLICDEQGLFGHELFAIDGCKMPSNASKEWSGTFKELEQKRDKIKRQIRYHLAAHKKQDKHQNRVDERDLQRKQTIETLNQAFEKIDHFLKSESPRMGQGKIKKEVKSNISDNESAKMKTSKGTIQGYNGLAAVDKKHQVIIDAQAFGEGQEHHTLQPILESVEQRYRRLKINKAIYKSNITVTADTGFANESNMQYLHENKINAYIPDNQFRSRDPRFSEQKEKYGKRHHTEKKKTGNLIPAGDFNFDQTTMTCVCPGGQQLSFRNEGSDKLGNHKAFFEGKLLQCRHCDIKQHCMKNPQSADHRKGKGRQVSFILKKNAKRTYTDWMKLRVDSEEGKQIYSHRMSTVEPVFGNIGTNKRLNRFSLRGRRKVQGQWQLYCIAHNIEKIMNYGQIAA
ncbi:MAG: IS1182 family transposase [Candidatus Thiodiazotropha sp. (ex. Lucinoma kazani)]